MVALAVRCGGCAPSTLFGIKGERHKHANALVLYLLGVYISSHTEHGAFCKLYPDCALSQRGVCSHATAEQPLRKTE